jgi:hypothetical protein
MMFSDDFQFCECQIASDPDCAMNDVSVILASCRRALLVSPARNHEIIQRRAHSTSINTCLKR